MAKYKSDSQKTKCRVFELDSSSSRIDYEDILNDDTKTIIRDDMSHNKAGYPILTVWYTIDEEEKAT